MWSFVAREQKNGDPDDPADDHKGDWWDFVAHDAEHRLVLAIVPGARSIENAEEVVREVHDRTAGHHLTDRHHNARKSRKTYHSISLPQL